MLIETLSAAAPANEPAADDETTRTELTETVLQFQVASAMVVSTADLVLRTAQAENMEIAALNQAIAVRLGHLQTPLKRW